MTDDRSASPTTRDATDDSLSEVLALLAPRRHGSGFLDFGGDWSLAIGKHRGIKCYAVAKGSCWIAVEGVPDPLRLSQGDCILLASGRPFRLCSDLERLPMTVSQLPPYSGQGVCMVNGGGACQIFGGHFKLDDEHERALAWALPIAVVIRDEEGRETLRWLLERMLRELFDPQAGGRLIVQHLSHVMLIYALRRHLQSGADGAIGWLSALSDRRIAAAISAMHAAPDRAWTVGALAHQAGMSRTSFAERFKTITGVAPMGYLAHWRITLGAIRLRSGDGTIASIARRVGYRSESAFSTAFRREFGIAPKDYARADA